MTREEAINKVRQMSLPKETMDILEALAPELAENEDEVIRKELKEAFEAYDIESKWNGIPVRSIFAWLEKQEIFSKGEGCYYYHADGSYTFIGSMGFGPIKDIKINGERPKTENKSVSVDLPGACPCVEKQKEPNKRLRDKTPWIVTAKEELAHTEERLQANLEELHRIRAEKEKQKEQKPISNPKWAELTWKDINELERIINNVHYEFQNGIGEDSFGELVLERFKEYKDDGSMDEQKPAECERQPEFKEVEYDFRGEKVKVMRPFFRDDKGREFSTTGQDTDLTWSVLREWCEIKGITPYDLYPRAEWSEEDEEMLDIVLTMVDCSTVVPHSGGQLHPSESYKKDISDWLKSLRPQPKPEWSEEEKEFIKHCAELLDGQGEPMCALRLESLLPQKLDASKLENYDPVEVLNKIKTEWPMAWEKVIGKQEWSEEDETHRDFILESLEDQIRFCKKNAEGAYYANQIRTAQNWLKALPLSLKKNNEDVAKLCSNEWTGEDEMRLNHLIKFVEKYGLQFYASTDKVIEWLKSRRPSWKPSEDEERLINTSISFLKDFADKGYENAVECIDWLKSKLNGNTCK